MESSPKCKTCFWVLTFTLLLSYSGSQVSAKEEENSSLELTGGASESWPMTMATSYADSGEWGREEDKDEVDGRSSRRSLFWNRVRYYISYGALSADRVPCPPRSGRSYYTHSCYYASGPVHPYVRGCSAITRCRI